MAYEIIFTKIINIQNLKFIIFLSLQSTLTEREGKEDENSSLFQSYLLGNGLSVISRL